MKMTPTRVWLAVLPATALLASLPSLFAANDDRGRTRNSGRDSRDSRNTSAAPAPSQAANANTGRNLKGYEKYQLFNTRMVFDPERRPPPRAVTAAPPSSGPPPRRSTPVTLVGTMENNGKVLAFFSSPQPDLNKVITVRQSIAGFTITNISAGTVEAELNGKKTLLSIGSNLPIEGASSSAASTTPETPGTASAPTGDAPSPAGDGSTPPSNNSSPAAAAPGAASAPASDADEIRRRMMERRMKEQ